jgi:hypothetical protein
MKNSFKMTSVALACLLATSAMATDSVPTEAVTDAETSRADWLRGSWGLNWKPTDLWNGAGEELTIDLFLEQISHLRTIDYVQVHLNESYINSPSHLGTHELLESFWEGDVSILGTPMNLVVPRASTGVDPFLEIIKKIQKDGMKVQVYLNSSNVLTRGANLSNPSYMPNITERWKEWVDTNPAAQAFIASQPYHTGIWDEASQTYVDASDSYPERKYMFAYAEFVLKDYAVRYGNLIDGWLFDSGSFMYSNGDNATNGVKEDQKIYKAFADAVHAGNPMAAVSFNNSPNRVTESLNPFSEATHYDDYMFGHPYNGGRYLGNHDNGIYERNYAHIQKVTATNGNVHSGSLDEGTDSQNWDWDDKVVGHFDPPMSRTRWNSGGEPGLTDEEFVQWNYESAVGGGAISWGAPLRSPPGSGELLTINDWGIAQLGLMDPDLAKRQAPGAPNWSRAHTVLTDSILAQPYTYTLVQGHDFWDPEGVNEVTLTLLPEGAPAWLTLVKDEVNPGHWILQGQPTETEETFYEFVMQATDIDGTTDRVVKLRVGEFIPDPVPVIPEPILPSLTKIFAMPDHNYGDDTVAIMESEVISTPDGAATFQIAFDVTPEGGTSIQSGASGGVATVNSWGVKSSDAGNLATIFNGNESESVESMGNIRVTNFQANGSCLTADDITELEFFNAEIVNAQSSHDRVLVTANGVINAEDGLKMGANVAQHRLNYGAGLVTEVIIGVGNASNQGKNKWSINHIEVAYDVDDSALVIGDFNCDGVLSPTDMPIIKGAKGSEVGDADYVYGTDLNGDGVVTQADYVQWVALFSEQQSSKNK